MIQVLHFLTRHPLTKKSPVKAILRFISWQIYYRLLRKSQLVFSLTEKSKIILKPHLTGVSGNYYCGLLEFDEMSFLLHFLNSTDLFVDVGANAGVYTILASAHSGAAVISFEPDTTSANLIEDNLSLNSVIERVAVIRKVVGERPGTVRFSIKKDTVNHVFTNTDTGPFVEKEVCTLDSYLDKSPILIKIDVEGYEWNVLNGARELLKSELLKALIIEINGSGAKFGISDYDLHQFIVSFGFHPYAYRPFTKELIPLSHYGAANTIYIRNIEFVTERIANSSSFHVLNQRV